MSKKRNRNPHANYALPREVVVQRAQHAASGAAGVHADSGFNASRKGLSTSRRMGNRSAQRRQAIRDAA